MTCFARGLGLSTIAVLAAGCSSLQPFQGRVDGPPRDGYELVFEEQFDGTDADLDASWAFQNGPSGHILCSRWRENAELDDGILKMNARKETRAGQDWTAASLWTKEQFKYGYFECRYRYADATGTNNSFWLMTRGPHSEPGCFEIDINEGHHPHEVNMNLHKWSGEHWAKGGRWYYHGTGPGTEAKDAGFSFSLEQPITASKLRLVSNDYQIVRIMEFRAFAPSTEGYPNVFPSSVEAQPDVVNLTADATIEATSVLKPEYGPEKVIDGKLTTESRWVSGKDVVPRILTLSFPEPREIGCIQFISGWQEDDGWRGIVHDFRIEYWDGGAWRPVPGAASSALAEEQRDPNAPANLAEEFHVYGLEWTEKELVYYFDGKEIRRIENDICHRECPVYLSLAIIRWGGPVTDAIDGTSMDVDWVRVWQRKQ